MSVIDGRTISNLLPPGGPHLKLVTGIIIDHIDSFFKLALGLIYPLFLLSSNDRFFFNNSQPIFDNLSLNDLFFFIKLLEFWNLLSKMCKL